MTLQPAGTKRCPDAGRSCFLSAPVLRAGRTQLVLLFGGDPQHAGQQKGYSGARPRHPVQSAHRVGRLHHLQRCHQRSTQRPEHPGIPLLVDDYMEICYLIHKKHPKPRHKLCRIPQGDIIAGKGGVITEWRIKPRKFFPRNALHALIASSLYRTAIGLFKSWLLGSANTGCPHPQRAAASAPAPGGCRPPR